MVVPLVFVVPAGGVHAAEHTLDVNLITVIEALQPAMNMVVFRFRERAVVVDWLIDGPAISDHNSETSTPNGFTMQVSIRELKAHLSQYLSRAQAGQSLEITSHRKVVARIIGVPAKSDQGLVRLLAGGAATWAGGKPAGASFRLSAKGTPVSQMVMEDRG